ncbi:MAG: hypothetical protein ACPGU7_07065 [Gammaproteobacteria bacterium]
MPTDRGTEGPLRVRGANDGAMSGHVWGPGGPLWQRAPTHDDSGRMAADFMLLIPKLNQRAASDRDACIRTLERVMRAHDQHIIFADLNLKLNLLWVSFRPADGVMAELVADIQRYVPTALLIAHHGQIRRRQRGPRALWTRVRKHLLPTL